MHNTLLADERSVIADLSWLSEGYAQKSFAAQAPAAELGGQHTAGERRLTKPSQRLRVRPNTRSCRTGTVLLVQPNITPVPTATAKAAMLPQKKLFVATTVRVLCVLQRILCVGQGRAFRGKDEGQNQAQAAGRGCDGGGERKRAVRVLRQLIVLRYQKKTRRREAKRREATRSEVVEDLERGGARALPRSTGTPREPVLAHGPASGAPPAG